MELYGVMIFSNGLPSVAMRSFYAHRRRKVWNSENFKFRYSPLLQKSSGTSSLAIPKHYYKSASPYSNTILYCSVTPA